jgi:hypothetical protein
MAAGLMGTMLEFMTPLLTCEAPSRGDPLAGSPADVLTPRDAAASQAGVSAIKSRDPAFDPQTLTAFAGQVYAAVAAAWGANDASPVRPVLADRLWEPMAAAMTNGTASSVGVIFSLMQARAAPAGVWSSANYDTALFTMAVHIDVPAGADGLPPGFTPDWTEDWLFQRSITPGSAPMQAPDQCPSCGASTDTDQEGRCTHCREPVPVLTSGWLVTAVRAHNPMVDAFLSQVVAEISQKPALLAQMPDDVVRLLPAQAVISVAPERAAALHLHP